VADLRKMRAKQMKQNATIVACQRFRRTITLQQVV
jgi:hypothetical protein